MFWLFVLLFNKLFLDLVIDWIFFVLIWLIYFNWYFIGDINELFFGFFRLFIVEEVEVELELEFFIFCFL